MLISKFKRLKFQAHSQLFVLTADYKMKHSPEWLSCHRKSTLGGIDAFLYLLEHLTLHSNYSMCTTGAAWFNSTRGGKLSLIECKTAVAVKIPAAFSIWDHLRFSLGSDGLKHAPFDVNKSILGQNRCL